MKGTPDKTRVIRRTAKGNLSESDRLEIVKAYMESELSNKEIAEQYNTSETNVELIVSRHWKSLTNVREAKALVGDQMNNLNHRGGNYHALKAIQKVPSINQDFISLLSDPDSEVLTDQELQYCFNYIATGDNYQSLHEAGLHVGIMGNAGDKKRHEYQLSCRLRGHYIRQKRNVAKYLQELKEKKYLPEIIDQAFVQREILEHLYQLKSRNDDGACDAKIERTIEMMGKTVGAFSDVIKVQEVDPSKALDYIESLSAADAHLVETEGDAGDILDED